MNNDDLNFAYKVRHALNENLETLPAATMGRLAAARRTAVSRKKEDGPLPVALTRLLPADTGSGLFNARLSWAGRMGLAVPLAALTIGLVSLYQFSQQQRISDIAEIDAAVLSDELPLSAYLDDGFNAYLSRRGE